MVTSAISAQDLTRVHGSVAAVDCRNHQASGAGGDSWWLMIGMAAGAARNGRPPSTAPYPLPESTRSSRTRRLRRPDVEHLSMSACTDWLEVLTAQCGVVSLRQAVRHLTRDTVRWRIRDGQWQRPHARVVVTHNDPLTDEQRRCVGRRTRVARGVVDTATWLAHERHARGVVLASVQQGLLTPQGLTDALATRGPCKHHAVIAETIVDATGGIHSVPEAEVRGAGPPPPATPADLPATAAPAQRSILAGRGLERVPRFGRGAGVAPQQHRCLGRRPRSA